MFGAESSSGLVSTQQIWSRLDLLVCCLTLSMCRVELPAGLRGGSQQEGFLILLCAARLLPVIVLRWRMASSILMEDHFQAELTRPSNVQQLIQEDEEKLREDDWSGGGLRAQHQDSRGSLELGLLASTQEPMWHCSLQRQPLLVVLSEHLGSCRCYFLLLLPAALGSSGPAPHLQLSARPPGRRTAEGIHQTLDQRCRSAPPAGLGLHYSEALRDGADCCVFQMIRPGSGQRSWDLSRDPLTINVAGTEPGSLSSPPSSVNTSSQNMEQGLLIKAPWPLIFGRAANYWHLSNLPSAELKLR